MNAPLNPENTEICVQHNLPIVFYDPDPKKGAFCVSCLQKMTGLILGDTLQQQSQKIIRQQQQNNNLSKQELESTLDSIIKYKESLDRSLEKIIKIILDQIQSIITFTTELEKTLKSDTSRLISTAEIQKKCQNQENHNQQVRKLVNQQLYEIKKQYGNIDQLYVQTLAYELIQKQIENVKFRAFAFNKDGNILIRARDQLIDVYDFNNGKISKELQTLNKHKDQIITLYFMQKTNSFVSGSWDKTIIVWELDEKKKWFSKFGLNGHNNSISSIIMNKNEDLLISASQDNSLKFWVKNSGWFGNYDWSCQQTIEPQCVSLLSLSDSQQKLIADGHGELYILEMQDQKWEVVQIIKSSNSTLESCFTIGDQFILQNINLGQLYVYNYNMESKKFILAKQFNTDKGSKRKSFIEFSSQYIKESKILAFKNGKCINIFKITEEGNCQLLQKIEFENDRILGRFTNDGKYLITQDYESLETQVRMLSSTE